MSFESKQVLSEGGDIAVQTMASAQIVRLEITDDDGMNYVTLKIHEAKALVGTLQTAVDLANIYQAGDL
ncbi:hypothetical protein [Methylobacter sp.]|uniref:hypothetical protein n=1 Tax=Methylobacter sp. TaxID=2051955 RepID=UPI002FDC9A1B